MNEKYNSGNFIFRCYNFPHYHNYRVLIENSGFIRAITPEYSAKINEIKDFCNSTFGNPSLNHFVDNDQESKEKWSITNNGYPAIIGFHSKDDLSLFIMRFRT
jgi:hypothetical protein